MVLHLSTSYNIKVTVYIYYLFVCFVYLIDVDGLSFELLKVAFEFIVTFQWTLNV